MAQIAQPAWLAARQRRFDRIEPRRTALLVIDMQAVFVGETGFGPERPYAKPTIAKINQLSATLRDAGGLIVFTRHTVTDEGPSAMPEWQKQHPAVARILPYWRSGTPEHALDPRMDTAPGDVVVDKYRYSAFTHNSSPLHDILQKHGVDTVIVAGVITNCCCESTARDAYMLGYRTFFVADATAAVTQEQHEAALLSLAALFADVRDTDEMKALITGA